MACKFQMRDHVKKRKKFWEQDLDKNCRKLIVAVYDADLCANHFTINIWHKTDIYKQNVVLPTNVKDRLA